MMPVAACQAETRNKQTSSQIQADGSSIRPRPARFRTEKSFFVLQSRHLRSEAYPIVVGRSHRPIRLNSTERGCRICFWLPYSFLQTDHILYIFPVGYTGNQNAEVVN